MITASDAVSAYILAKDGNRPFLMRRAFTNDAELEVIVKSDAISFPNSAKGLSALEDILVRRFGLDYENVFTFCLSRPSEANRFHFPCHWLVGMSARGDGQIRVGCGRYDWHFGKDGRVEKLAIAIDCMTVLPAAELSASMIWLSSLPYPWCSPDQAIDGMPTTEGYAEIANYLKLAGPIAPER
ncbi:hypothetical protein JQ624_25150 [Bradyrhizobium sp. AUGA SZCCT0283]|nr:hypothetical protein [Bradyrhizobium sp. AUGA SZCCT0283]